MPSRFQTSGGTVPLSRSVAFCGGLGGKGGLGGTGVLAEDRGINWRVFGRRSELLSLGPSQQEDPRLEGHLVRSYRAL